MNKNIVNNMSNLSSFPSKKEWPRIQVGRRGVGEGGAGPELENH